VTAATSDRHAMRAAFQNVSDPGDSVYASAIAAEIGAGT
jgi:hypothetical protein